MKRTLLVVAAGLIGLLLGIGVSLVADAVAGNELSDPVPLGIATENVLAPASPQQDRPKETATPTHDQADDHGGSDGNSGPGGGSTETQAPSSPQPTQTESGDGSGSHEDDSSGESEGSDD